MWRHHGISSEQVVKINRVIAAGAPDLWAYAKQLIRDAVERGYLAP